jgi:hypothetical protein
MTYLPSLARKWTGCPTVLTLIVARQKEDLRNQPVMGLDGDQINGRGNPNKRSIKIHRNYR